MDHERKELLAQKKAQLKKRQKRAEIQQYKDRLTKSIEHFSQKYRYVDEAEALKIEAFISRAAGDPRSLPISPWKCLLVLLNGN